MDETVAIAVAAVLIAFLLMMTAFSGSSDTTVSITCANGTTKSITVHQGETKELKC